MATIQDIAALGYAVSPAFSEKGGPTVYYVEGFGVMTYISDDDTATISSFCDPNAQADRANQALNGAPIPAPIQPLKP